MELEAIVGAEESEFSVPPLVEPEEGSIPGEVTRHLIKGSSALGLAIVIERGMGFLANILAARLGGAATFGAYSLAISTANNISTYAGGGIGSTAARFSGKYPRSSRGYPTLARALILVSLVSAVLAAGGLWLGAAPIAHLLHKPSVTGLLHWTAISAAGIILLECARGFFVGQARLTALVLLSLVVGVGMVLLIPLAAKIHHPTRMIVLQGIITTTAVMVCMALARPLGLQTLRASGTALPLGPMLQEVWTFGFVQLAGLIGVNLAGWWLTTLVARADTSLVQMSFFAIASQLRNIAGLAPSLLTESSYAVMADPEDGPSSTPQHVMALCTYAATLAALVLAALGILLAPWALRLVYGSGYDSSVTAVVIALAVAVVHMGNAPAAARLSIVSIRALGIINTIWACFVAAAATIFLLHAGSAWRAMSIYLAGHLVSAALVLIVLRRKDFVPRGMASVFFLGSGTAILLTVLACLRVRDTGLSLTLTGAMALLAAGSMAVLLAYGRRYRWLPSASACRHLLGSIDRALGLVRRMLRTGAFHGA
jgi:O-antigen/teichoic acid export membrane protein